MRKEGAHPLPVEKQKGNRNSSVQTRLISVYLQARQNNPQSGTYAGLHNGSQILQSVLT
jgi:hypothetical protein